MRVRCRGGGDTSSVISALRSYAPSAVDDATQPAVEGDAEFDLQLLQQNLTTSTFAWTAATVRSIPSTQTLLLDPAIAKSLPHGFVLFADEQTAGIGRSNNAWESPAGCLMLSAKLHCPRDTPAPMVQYVVSIAAAQAGNEAAADASVDCRLKWPNDVLLHKQKLAGVLTAVDHSSGSVVVGLGMNVRNETAFGTSLKQHVHRSLEPNELIAARLLNRTEALLHQLERDGWRSVEPVYLRMWLHSGQRVRVKRGASPGSGTAAAGEVDVTIRGLTDNGYLLAVDDRTGTRHELHPEGTSLDIYAGLVTRKG